MYCKLISNHLLTVGDRKAEDSYKAASLAPGSVKEVNQSLSSALSAAGIKPSGGGADSVPGYVRQAGDKFGPGAATSQRSPGPMITKSDTLGYNSQAYYQGQSSVLTGGQLSVILSLLQVIDSRALGNLITTATEVRGTRGRAALVTPAVMV